MSVLSDSDAAWVESILAARRSAPPAPTPSDAEQAGPPLVISLQAAADPALLGLAQLKSRAEGRQLVIDSTTPKQQALVFLSPAEASNAITYDKALRAVDGDYTRVRIKP